MKNKQISLKTIAAFIMISTLIFLSCSKKDTTTTTTKTTTTTTVKNQLTLISNPSIANATNNLQGVYLNNINNLSFYYYGSFDGSGNALHMKEAIVKRNTSDTAVNLIYNTSNQVIQMYFSVGTTPDTNIISFTYYTDSVVAYFGSFNSTFATYKEKCHLVFTQSGNNWVLSGHTDFKIPIRHGRIGSSPDTVPVWDNFTSAVYNANASSIFAVGFIGLATVVIAPLAGGVGGLVCIAIGGYGIVSALTSSDQSAVENSSETNTNTASTDGNAPNPITGFSVFNPYP